MYYLKTIFGRVIIKDIKLFPKYTFKEQLESLEKCAKSYN